MANFALGTAHHVFNAATGAGRCVERLCMPSGHAAAVAVVETDGPAFHGRRSFPIYLTDGLHKVFTIFR